MAITRSIYISRSKIKTKNIKKSKTKNTKQNARINKTKINKKNRKTKKTMKGGHVEEYRPPNPQKEKTFKVKIKPEIPLFLQPKKPIIKSYIQSTIGTGKLNPLQLAPFGSQKDIPPVQSVVNPNVIEKVAALLEKKMSSSQLPSHSSSQSTHHHQHQTS